MKKIEIIALLFLSTVGIGQSEVLYYTYEGVLGQITGKSELLTQQGFSVGDDFMYVLMIDFDRIGESTKNSGEVVYPQYNPISYYADLIYSTKIEDIDGGSHNEEWDYLEHNFCFVEEHEGNMFKPNCYVGSGDAYIHLSSYSLSPIPFREWKVGVNYDIGVTFTVFDSSGNSSAGYTHGIFTSISETNPIPEPATLSLLAIGGFALLRKRKA